MPPPQNFQPPPLPHFIRNDINTNGSATTEEIAQFTNTLQANFERFVTELNHRLAYSENFSNFLLSEVKKYAANRDVDQRLINAQKQQIVNLQATIERLTNRVLELVERCDDYELRWRYVSNELSLVKNWLFFHSVCLFTVMIFCAARK